MLTIRSTFEATAIVPANAQGPYVVNAGTPLLLSAGNTHPDASYSWDLGDGTVANTASVSHAYADDGLYIAKLTVAVNQPGGATSRHFALIRVRNVPPVVNAGPDRTVNEGDVVDFVGTFTDVEYLDTHEATWDWGDEQHPDAGVISETHAPPQAQGTASASHAWGDNGTYVVTLSVRDEDGGVGRDTLTMTVLNVPPTVDAGPDLFAYPCTVLTLAAEFTDPGWLDTHNGTWEFGDCTPLQPAVIRETNEPPKGEGVAIASHTYECCGTYAATCTVIDDDGGVGRDTVVVRVVDVENPGFEAGFRERAAGAVGNHWEPYRAQIPTYGAPPAQELEVAASSDVFSCVECPVHGGQRSQRIRFAEVSRFGIRQSVGANPGWDYQVTAWYSIAERSDSIVRLGVDPAGGTDPTAATVHWVEGRDREAWSQLAIRATAGDGNAITIFAEAQPATPGGVTGAHPGPSCEVYFDDFALLAVQPFCPDRAELPTPPPEQRGEACANFDDVAPGTEVPPIYEKDKFVFASLDKGPQQIVGWGPPPGRSKLQLRAGVWIHLPFIADRVRLTVWTQKGAPLVAEAAGDSGSVVASATTAASDAPQTLELVAARIVALRLRGGHGESTLMEICARLAPDEKQARAPKAAVLRAAVSRPGVIRESRS